MTAALIITNGRTDTRRAFAPSKEVGTISAVRRIVRVFQCAGVERIVAVCGEEVRKETAHMGLVFLGGRPEGEMLDNVKTGLAYLRGKCGAALVTHVNVPLFSAGTVRTLLEAEGDVRVPVCGGVPGHPVLLRAERFPDVLAYVGAGGLAGAVRALSPRRVEVPDEGILANIAGGESYGRLVEGHDLAHLRFDLQLRLAREQIFYGPGAHQLLQLTGETGSLLEACRQMGISYSKGRKIVASIERQTGRPVLESRQGGPAGGGSALTEEGRRLVERYAALCREANERLEEIFEKYFPRGPQS